MKGLLWAAALAAIAPALDLHASRRSADSASAPLTSATAGAATPMAGERAAPPMTPRKSRLVTYVTGDIPGADVVFKVAFNPNVAYSGVVSVAVTEARGYSLDGIDFVPGAPGEIAVGCPPGAITHYNVLTGATLPDFIPDTDMIALPPASPGTWPSTVLSTPMHAYYIENQFGFGATVSHRIMRKPFVGGPVSVVYDGAAHGLENFEGLEIVGGRLYFFAKDPGPPDARALISVGLTGAGVWDGMPFAMEIPGLTEAPGPGTDGSDELDFDPHSGLIFGTNIVNGEMIAFDPVASVEVSSPGSTHFIDAADIAASSGDLGLLDGMIDGVRSTNTGWIVVTGKAGVIAAIRVSGVLVDGADDGDVTPIVVTTGASFDDLTPIVRE